MRTANALKYLTLGRPKSLFSDVMDGVQLAGLASFALSSFGVSIRSSSSDRHMWAEDKNPDNAEAHMAFQLATCAKDSAGFGVVDLKFGEAWLLQAIRNSAGKTLRLEACQHTSSKVMAAAEKLNA